MTLPSLPSANGFYNLLFLLGLAIIVYISIDAFAILRELEEENNIQAIALAKVEGDAEYMSYQQNKVLRRSKFIAQKYAIPNPLTEVDSSVSLAPPQSNEADYLIAYEQIQLLYEAYVDSMMSLRKNLRVIKSESDNLQGDLERRGPQLLYYSVLTIIGLYFLYLGGKGVIRTQVYNDAILKEQYRAKAVHYDCQSCGIMFNSMHKRGEEKDGSLSYSFCANCYSNGIFTDPDFTADKAYRHIVRYKDVVSKREKRKLREKVFKLERWAKKNYFSV